MLRPRNDVRQEIAPVRNLRRYGGSRLCDRETRTYFSAHDLERLVRKGVRISIREVETDRDVTDEIIRPNLQ
ncbi:MAG: hypothetical protein K2Y56_18565 [Methylobacterium sp.]|uniref:polyhydroxyalkanoate synthesis regulator DNA-binding domain-containing protein n=1 Tax=Methylobacterium sp. TaxID=409 RepID=UPI0025D8096D|nr:polyhydroxyalkanoate synthesis regulator DNA-binding domain-containing protein [Methylobacterium sp.]MBX9933497.1 hypothetical protein [Methylobacterium sp.]